MSGRFVKGQSGNPNGRPRQRRPNVSAFDIIFDKTLTVNHGGVDREHSVDEVMELQTFQAALGGNRMAVRQVLKMIEKRESALAKLAPKATAAVRIEPQYDSENANEAMLLLGIAEYEVTPIGEGYRDQRFKLATWAAQAAISRPGRRRLSAKDVDDIKRLTVNADKLKWPRSIAHD
jgi:hypothetical protein